MKVTKLILISCLLFSLSGCAGLLAGNYSKTAATNPITGEVLLNRFGTPIYNKTRTARSVAIMQEGTSTRIESKTTDPCGELTSEVLLNVAKLTATGQGEFFRSRGDCQQTAMMGNVVAYATGQPTTAAGQVAREKQKAVAHSEKGLTDRTVGFVGGVVSGVTASAIAGAVETGFRTNRDLGVAGAENAGDITATINANQSVSSSSNDGVGGLGSGGSGGSGELGGSGGEGTGAPGTGGGNIESSQVGSTFVVGRRINSSQASDDAFSSAGVDNAQNVEESASAAQNNAANVDQQPIVDESNESEFSNQPSNGNDNGL